MIKNVEDVINEFVTERTSDIMSYIDQRENIMKQTEDEIETVKSIRALLPKDKQNLIIKLTDILDSKFTEMGCLFYKYGVKDGIKIKENLL